MPLDHSEATETRSSPTTLHWLYCMQAPCEHGWLDRGVWPQNLDRPIRQTTGPVPHMGKKKKKLIVVWRFVLVCTYSVVPLEPRTLVDNQISDRGFPWSPPTNEELQLSRPKSERSRIPLVSRSASFTFRLRARQNSNPPAPFSTGSRDEHPPHPAPCDQGTSARHSSPIRLECRALQLQPSDGNAFHGSNVIDSGIIWVRSR